MSIRKKFQKVRDKVILKKEIKCAKRMMLENSDNNIDEKKGKSIKILKINRQKLKDTGLIVGAVVLIGIGYANFTESKSEITEETSSSGYSEYGNNLGDVQLVNGEVDEEAENNIEEEQENSTEDLESEDELEENSEEESDLETLATTDLNAYFTELKLKRDNIYSEKLEAYEQIAQSDSISSEQKAIAIQEIENITETQNAISVAEELIKLKGFENVIIYVNNNSISVIVRSAALSLEEVAQIQNIIIREFDVELSEISISSK